MSLISGSSVTGAGGAGAYEISRSLRFNSADSAYLNRTFSAPTDGTKWTLSFWMKRSALGRMNIFGYNGATNEGSIDFDSGNTLYINPRVGTVGGAGTNYFLQTTQVFRDVSAWYHIIYALDTTQATASNRVKLYVNGTQVTTFSTTNYPPQNSTPIMGSAVSHAIGRIGESGYEYYFGGYLTEINFIDGQALTPSSFGEYNSDTGVWQPIEYTGTYGTNGFYLNFSDNSSTSALGTDYSGNGNNWTPNNFSVTAGAGNDSLVDTPTPYGTDTGAGGEVRGNYATLNAVKPVTNSITFSNGNLQYKPGSSWSTTTYVEGTIGVLGGSTGKYYWEMSADQVGGLWTAGVALQNNTIGGSNIGTTGSVMIYDNAKYVNGTSTSSYLTSLSANEVLGVALDAATGKVWFRDSGGWLGSGDPAAGTNETGIPTGFSGATLVPVTQANSASTVTANFGQRPFAYTAPSGFKALCTQNLPEPAIAAGGDYFNTVLYTGNGSTQSVSGVGFQPDWTWIKIRNAAGSHALADAVRGSTIQLASNNTDAEITRADTITSFASDGFNLGANTTGYSVNINAQTYVAWNWKANGAGSSNTAGSITSTVSVNTTSGFSIVTYTHGSGVGASTVGHGLGVAPNLILSKFRDGTTNWDVYVRVLGPGGRLKLNSTDGFTSETEPWNNTNPTATVFSVGPSSWKGVGNHVAYCFAEVPGYSRFGSYIGNGSADGPFVYTGFRPAYVLIKSSSNAEEWHVHDTARDTYNLAIADLYPNSSGAEVTTFNQLDILSNGFKCRSSNTGTNGSGYTFIYMAFAENPFKYSLAR